MTIQQEEYRTIKGYENQYQVSNLGNVYSVWFDRTLMPQVRSHGYKSVMLRKDGESKGFLVHRLVAQAFIQNPGKPQVNHKNGIKTDNRIENLEWVTVSENALHAHKTGLSHAHGLPAIWRHKRITAYGNNESPYLFDSITEAAKVLGLKRSAISNVLTGRAASSGGYKFQYEDQ